MPLPWLCRQTGYSRLPLKEEPEGSSPSRAAISNVGVDKLVIVTRFSSWNLRVRFPSPMPFMNQMGSETQCYQENLIWFFVQLKTSLMLQRQPYASLGSQMPYI